MFFNLITKTLFVLKIINFCDFFQGGQRFLQWKFKNSSRTFQKHINTFQVHKRRWKYHSNWFEGFFEKLNLIITKDKSHEIQISTRTKLRKSYHHKIISGTYIKASVSKRWIMKKIRVFYEAWKVKFKKISRTNP